MKLLLGHSAAMRLLSVIFVIALTDVDATIRFLQLSDFHVDVDYSINGDPTKACHKVWVFDFTFHNNNQVFLVKVHVAIIDA